VLDAVIDVSHHQSRVHFGQVKAAGVLGVIHKATQGFATVDARCAPRRDLATSVGLRFGVYHFGTEGDGARQADHFLAHAQPGDLMVLDFEANSGGSHMDAVEAACFIERIHEKTGRWPGFYTTRGWASAQIPEALRPRFAPCWLWLARYADAPGTVPAPWQTWTLWQHTDGVVGATPHACDGVGACDRDKFSGSAEEFQAFWSAQARP